MSRPLRPDEAMHFTDTARRIAAVLLLAPRLDDNYRSVVKDLHPFAANAQRQSRSDALQGEEGPLL